ncbi:MAG: hypothetical protein WCP20_16995 [Desulfuromonadales bacterium]
MKKLIAISIVAVLFLTVLFLDQNRSPVPVKIILGNPHPIGLSIVIIISMFAGAAMTIAGLLGYIIVRRREKNWTAAD